MERKKTPKRCHETGDDPRDGKRRELDGTWSKSQNRSHDSFQGGFLDDFLPNNTHDSIGDITLSNLASLDQATFNLSNPPAAPPALFYSSSEDLSGGSFNLYPEESLWANQNCIAMNGIEPFPPSFSHEICYGMLANVEVHLKWPPDAYQPVPEVLDVGQTYVRLRMELKSDHGLIQMLNGRAVAVLDMDSFRALSLCGTVAGFRTDVWVLQAEWNEKTTEVQKLQTTRRKIVLMKIKLLLFGHRDAGDQVAATLGRFQGFLQPPDEGMSDCPYENPQSLQVPDPPTGIRMVDRDLPGTLMIGEAYETEERTDKPRDGNAAQLADLITDIDVLFDKLPVHRSTDMASRDSRILTPLFRHQQEALDFMIRREARGSSLEAGLYELKTFPTGEDYYQNSITGAKSKSPRDFMGGILADAMGLGKTLTTLTLIVASLGRARDFVSLTSQMRPAGHGTITTSKASLIIVPSELLLNTWVREIERHLYPRSIRYAKYHGQDRQQLDAELDQQDILLTTYGTVMAEHRRGPGRSALHRIDWFRLILDEAHTIRNWSSKQFSAVCSISSKARWCLTGTPIQNSLDDLGSLIKFLQMPIFNETAIFRKYVTKLHYNQGATNGEFKNLQLILSSICLRRNKTVLPNSEHEVELVRPVFTQRERRDYRGMELACKRAISIASKGLGDDRTHHMVMEALLRLRLFCNNGPADTGSGIFSALQPSARPDEMLSFLQQSGEAICAYCSVDILSIGSSSEADSACLTPCGRLVCSECYQHYRSGQSECEPFICPFCHAEHSVSNSQEGGLVAQIPGEKQWPSKIMAVVQNVKTHYLGDKCVIFSFWKKTLDLLGAALEAGGIKYLRVDGDVPAKKRNTVLLEFQNRAASRVLLMTFSTGAVGLNGLTVANRVHILEPQWNPAVENQAIGRVLRLGQQRRVTILRYAMQQSIEEVVQSRQVRKLQLASGGFLSQEERRELRSNQLQQLRDYLEASGLEEQ